MANANEILLQCQKSFKENMLNNFLKVLRRRTILFWKVWGEEQYYFNTGTNWISCEINAHRDKSMTKQTMKKRKSTTTKANVYKKQLYWRDKNLI